MGRSTRDGIVEGQMYVKSLSLKGFKSFADPVTLDMQPGVNVVVGPNGSGKSNVIDAVAWVLGAQGARALRGGKMDDVIFAGSGKRPALGRAEVSLTIDNADRRIPMDFSEVTLTRTLFRTGESEYQINGVACRLLDIQELLSDSGVGRQQHVIVSQGNLDAVLAARPEDRRMIIEEAAGVLKHRKRREKSQRRLESTEANLERLADLVREVRQQMRPLEKQAAAAQRHDDVASKLHALKLYVFGRDIARLQDKQTRGADRDREMREADEQLRADLVTADRDVNTAEGELESLGVQDYTEHVERLQTAVERAKGIGQVLVQRRRTLESELSASVNADVIASLDHDASTTRRDLESVTVERRSMSPRFEEITQAEAHLANEWLTFEGEWGEGLPVNTNEAAEVRFEINARRSAVENLERDVTRQNSKLNSAREVATSSESTRDTKQAELAALQNARDEDAVESAQRTSNEFESRLEERNARLQEVQTTATATATRVEMLGTALDATRARAGVEKLADVQGVTGTLADLVEIDGGYEAAFEAAAGDALSAVVVDSIDVANAALRKLHDGDVEGAVLALGVSIDPFTARVPNGAELLRGRVRGNNDATNSLLDRLIGRVAVVDGGWEQAVAVAASNATSTIVTIDGDRFSPSGWRIGKGGQGVTQAALEEARREADGASEALARARDEVAVVREQLHEARTAVDRATRGQREFEQSTSACRSAIERAEERLAGARNDVEDATTEISSLRVRLDGERTKLSELQERLPRLEAEEASGAERAKRWRDARSVLEDRSNDLRARRAEVELRSKALDERRDFLSQRVATLTERLERHKEEFEQAAARRVGIEEQMTVIDRLGGLVRKASIDIERHLETARSMRNRVRDLRREFENNVRDASARRSRCERELTQITERRQQHEIEQAEIRVRLENLMVTLQSDLGIEVETALNAPEPELPDGSTAKARIVDLERDLRQMGPINPLALEELNAVQERHRFLDEQLTDIQNSRRELMGVIKAVDTEIVDVFRMAFDDVAKNFKDLFEKLFPGGSGGLTLTDPENLLETGIEIEAKPSGKNVRTLSLLSGGERSLAAMAFLFAVFRSRPSPFYLLDEVEAALDDINLQRFLTLLDEFRTEAQLVIVSHQKRTMERADCLYGVSMQQGGSTKVVSERVQVDLTETAV